MLRAWQDVRADFSMRQPGQNIAGRVGYGMDRSKMQFRDHRWLTQQPP